MDKAAQRLEEYLQMTNKGSKLIPRLYTELLNSTTIGQTTQLKTGKGLE